MNATFSGRCLNVALMPVAALVLGGLILSLLVWAAGRPVRSVSEFLRTTGGTVIKAR
jgi:hypothetical protein